ncbi:hypothetical protein, partial [Paenibacillus polymyxa]|uniref:hypothetical protein n=1 Tax=Paenibacillus polymyxa TaxID=1406 RepID=UPI00159EF885
QVGLPHAGPAPGAQDHPGVLRHQTIEDPHVRANPRFRRLPARSLAQASPGYRWSLTPRLPGIALQQAMSASSLRYIAF